MRNHSNQISDIFQPLQFSVHSSTEQIINNNYPFGQKKMNAFTFERIRTLFTKKSKLCERHTKCQTLHVRECVT